MHTPLNTSNCVATAATQVTRQAVLKNHKKIELFGLRALWLHFADELDLRRLAKLHMRIQLRELALHDLKEERRQIMRRCTRRMRRAQGKN